MAAGLQACCAALVLFWVVSASLHAAPVKSEIADAAQRGDRAAVQAPNQSAARELETVPLSA